MAATIELKVNLDYQDAFSKMMRLDKMAGAMSSTPYVIKFDVQGAERLKDLQGLSRELNALARWQKEQNKAESLALKERTRAQKEAAQEAARIAKETQNTNTYLTSSAAQYDAQIKAAEASAHRFAAALQSQMQAEREAASAQEGLASSYNVIDQAIQANESAGREFSNQLRQQMQAEQELERENQKLGNSAEEAAGGWSILGSAIATALGHLASRAIHFAISKVTQGIREALTEMKAVDTQLTNISKVSGLTGKALSDMGERAYETASKYGVAADEYLSAVYTFQKAGLGPSAEAMGELAVKTMLVGDTTADVASQFLISANAAWEFGGNIERLGQLVDEADYINNNYATDLEKLSSGLPRVASIAAQAGMSAEETLAALGTITAVTQESGTKAATALRALILNIEGQIGEFVDETGESFTVTEESVKSMQGLMEKYAKAELDAAKASGELINPMTAIKAIFEGMANTDLNDQELFSLLSGMGGKLRTNQLTALVKNYELFDEMLNRIADSAGTADGEIALMMESWERKTQVLKNTWTEFIADIVSTEFMKDAIDSLTNIVNALDGLVESGSDPWYKSGETNAEIEATEKKISDLKAAIDDLYGSSDQESNLRIHDLEVELQIQQEILETKKAQYDLEKAQDAAKLQKQLTRDYFDSTGTWTSVDIEELATLGRRLGDVAFEGNISEYQESLKSIVSDFSDYYDKVLQVKDAGVELTDSQQRFIDNYELANNLAETQGLHVGELVDGFWQLTDSTGNVVAEVKDITPELDDQQTALKKALKDLGTGASDVSSTVSAIDFANSVAGAEALTKALQAAADAAAGIAVGPIGFGFATGTANAPGGKTLVNELGPELISENGRAYIANGGKPAVVNLSKGAIVLPANVTKQALRGGGAKQTINAAADGTDFGTGLRIYGQPTQTTPTGPTHLQPTTHGRRIGEETVYADGWVCPKCGTSNPQNATKCSKCGASKSGSSGGGGGNGGKGDSKPKKSKKELAEEAAKTLADKLSNIDKRAQLAHTEERYDDEKALYRRAIRLIDAQIKKYRNAGFKNKSDEIVDLKNKRYSYKDKLASVEKTKWDDEIARRQQEHDAREQEDEMAKRQQAVADAQTALENAQRQRTVRVFNAATGQWEWVADQKAVQQAQDRLTSAQEAYDEAIYNQEIEELKRRRDEGEKYPGTKKPKEKAESVQQFVDQLGALYGDAPFEVSMAKSSAMGGGDSHDTVYNFGNITLSEAQAQSTSVAELAKRLNVLKIS